MKFYRVLLTTFLARYYHSIETMPIGRFSKCLQGDITQISKNGYYSERKLRQIWAKLFDQHLQAHGLPENYQEYIKKMVKAVGYFDQAYNGKKWQITKARVYEAEASQLLKGGGEKIETTCARLSKIMGFPIRSTECTVVEFYNYIAIIASN